MAKSTTKLKHVIVNRAEAKNLVKVPTHMKVKKVKKKRKEITAGLTQRKLKGTLKTPKELLGDSNCGMKDVTSKQTQNLLVDSCKKKVKDTLSKKVEGLSIFVKGDKSLSTDKKNLKNSLSQIESNDQNHITHNMKTYNVPFINGSNVSADSCSGKPCDPLPVKLLSDSNSSMRLKKYDSQIKESSFCNFCNSGSKLLNLKQKLVEPKQNLSKLKENVFKRPQKLKKDIRTKKKCPASKSNVANYNRELKTPNSKLVKLNLKKSNLSNKSRDSNSKNVSNKNSLIKSSIINQADKRKLICSNDTKIKICTNGLHFALIEKQLLNDPKIFKSLFHSKFPSVHIIRDSTLDALALSDFNSVNFKEISLKMTDNKGNSDKCLVSSVTPIVKKSVSSSKDRKKSVFSKSCFQKFHVNKPLENNNSNSKSTAKNIFQVDPFDVSNNVLSCSMKNHQSYMETEVSYKNKHSKFKQRDLGVHLSKQPIERRNSLRIASNNSEINEFNPAKKCMKVSIQSRKPRQLCPQKIVQNKSRSISESINNRKSRNNNLIAFKNMDSKRLPKCGSSNSVKTKFVTRNSSSQSRNSKEICVLESKIKIPSIGISKKPCKQILSPPVPKENKKCDTHMSAKVPLPQPLDSIEEKQKSVEDTVISMKLEVNDLLSPENPVEKCNKIKASCNSIVLVSPHYNTRNSKSLSSLLHSDSNVSLKEQNCKSLNEVSNLLDLNVPKEPDKSGPSCMNFEVFSKINGEDQSKLISNSPFPKISIKCSDKSATQQRFSSRRTLFSKKIRDNKVVAGESKVEVNSHFDSKKSKETAKKNLKNNYKLIVKSRHTTHSMKTRRASDGMFDASSRVKSINGFFNKDEKSIINTLKLVNKTPDDISILGTSEKDSLISSKQGEEACKNTLEIEGDESKFIGMVSEPKDLGMSHYGVSSEVSKDMNKKFNHFNSLSSLGTVSSTNTIHDPVSPAFFDNQEIINDQSEIMRDSSSIIVNPMETELNDPAVPIKCFSKPVLTQRGSLRDTPVMNADISDCNTISDKHLSPTLNPVEHTSYSNSKWEESQKISDFSSHQVQLSSEKNPVKNEQFIAGSAFLCGENIKSSPSPEIKQASVFIPQTIHQDINVNSFNNVLNSASAIGSSKGEESPAKTSETQDYSLGCLEGPQMSEVSSSSTLRNGTNHQPPPIFSCEKSKSQSVECTMLKITKKSSSSDCLDNIKIGLCDSPLISDIIVESCNQVVNDEGETTILSNIFVKNEDRRNLDPRVCEYISKIPSQNEKNSNSRTDSCEGTSSSSRITSVRKKSEVSLGIPIIKKNNSKNEISINDLEFSNQNLRSSSAKHLEKVSCTKPIYEGSKSFQLDSSESVKIQRNNESKSNIDSFLNHVASDVLMKSIGQSSVESVINGTNILVECNSPSICENSVDRYKFENDFNENLSHKNMMTDVSCAVGSNISNSSTYAGKSIMEEFGISSSNTVGDCYDKFSQVASVADCRSIGLHNSGSYIPCSNNIIGYNQREVICNAHPSNNLCKLASKEKETSVMKCQYSENLSGLTDQQLESQKTKTVLSGVTIVNKNAKGNNKHTVVNNYSYENSVQLFTETPSMEQKKSSLSNSSISTSVTNSFNNINSANFTYQMNGCNRNSNTTILKNLLSSNVSRSKLTGINKCSATKKPVGADEMNYSRNIPYYVSSEEKSGYLDSQYSVQNVNHFIDKSMCPKTLSNSTQDFPFYKQTTSCESNTLLNTSGFPLGALGNVPFSEPYHLVSKPINMSDNIKNLSAGNAETNLVGSVSGSLMSSGFSQAFPAGNHDFNTERIFAGNGVYINGVVGGDLISCSSSNFNLKHEPNLVSPYPANGFPILCDQVSVEGSLIKSHLSNSVINSKTNFIDNTVQNLSNDIVLLQDVSSSNSVQNLNSSLDQCSLTSNTGFKSSNSLCGNLDYSSPFFSHESIEPAYFNPPDLSQYADCTSTPWGNLNSNLPVPQFSQVEVFHHPPSVTYCVDSVPSLSSTTHPIVAYNYAPEPVSNLYCFPNSGSNTNIDSNLLVSNIPSNVSTDLNNVNVFDSMNYVEQFLNGQ